VKSYSAYFVRGSAPDVAGRVLGRAETVAESSWVVCGYRRGASPPDDEVLWGRRSLTAACSGQLGEVIFLFADSSPDSFVYEHARDGVLLRRLVWFPMLDDDWTPGWLCAEGQAEEWESALFSPAQLARVLEDERDSYADRGEEQRFPEREAEIRRAFSERIIAANATIPRADGTVALLVEQHFGLRRPPAA
jgi:hypothetical protein